MPNYQVSWVIDIVADTPKEAAEEALKIQRDPNSAAVCFDVYNLDTGTPGPHNSTFIDLDEDREEEEE